ncbi:MAG TPA: transglycosylase SLT domain-containing protein [Candidatus Polarisedimenticolia bacterium]|nr:transglycosylase SLT domain-containing protein [Candidatus Polarisedimenticolia bacterium]
MRSAACVLLVTACAAVEAGAKEEIYYRRDQSGALVLTNVPDHRDLRTYAGRGPVPGSFSGETFRAIITATALQNGVHPDLVYALASVESNFNPGAVSAKGAQGLMQLMPETAVRFGVVDPFNPLENIVGGVRYLRYLLDLFNGDQRLAIAAYNAGENIVLASKGIPPYPETRSYVAKVLRIFGNRKPYVPAKARPQASARSTAPSSVYTYTDDQGVVHYTDHPPAPGPLGSPGAESAGPH